MGMFYQSSTQNAAIIAVSIAERQLAEKPSFCDINMQQTAALNVNQEITITVQGGGHQQISRNPKYGVVMWSSFSKDWARWSRAERFTAQIVFLACTVGAASQAFIHMV